MSVHLEIMNNIMTKVMTILWKQYLAREGGIREHGGVKIENSRRRASVENRRLIINKRLLKNDGNEVKKINLKYA